MYKICCRGSRFCCTKVENMLEMIVEYFGDDSMFVNDMDISKH